MDEEYFTPKEAVPFLRAQGCPKVTVAGMATARSRGGGPQYRQSGRYIIYPKSSLIEWAALRISSTLDLTSTPHGQVSHDHFETPFDPDDLIDYRDPDPHFDEVTKLLEQYVDSFDYHATLKKGC